MATAFTIGAQLERARAIGSNRPPFRRMAQNSCLIKNGLDDSCFALANGLKSGRILENFNEAGVSRDGIKADDVRFEKEPVVTGAPRIGCAGGKVGDRAFFIHDVNSSGIPFPDDAMPGVGPEFRVPE